jgi:hypothetical protein
MNSQEAIAILVQNRDDALKSHVRPPAESDAIYAF